MTTDAVQAKSIEIPRVLSVKELGDLMAVSPVEVIKELMNKRMYPTTLDGLERAMRALVK